MSFSDFALFKLGSTKKAVSLLRKIDVIVRSFMDDSLDRHLPFAEAWAGQGKSGVRELKDVKSGQIVVHLLSELARPKRPKA